MTLEGDHPTDRPARPAPLAGLRIVAVEQYGAGPFGTLMLADLGADVIKVEDPTSGGDVSRYIPPVTQGTDSLFFEAFNRSKRSILLDLKSVAGREVFERLVASADAVFSNLRGDQPARLRLTYDDLKQVNERIVCVALTGYGRGPADAGLFGYDALVQAEAGWAALTGGPDDPPTKSGLSLADYMTGLVAMVGLLSAVMDARTTGQGRDVDTDLFDAALAMLSYPATWYLSAGISQRRLPLSAHPSVVPFGFFATADGHLAVATPKERFFGDLVRAMGLPDLAGDERFSDLASRSRNREALVDLLGARFAELTTDEWMERLRGVVPAAPVRSLEQALEPGRLAARGMLVEYEHPTLGRVRSVGVPLFLSDYEPTYRPGPGMGADEASVLADLGYDPGQIEALRDRGAFGERHAAEPQGEVAATGAPL